MRNNVRSYLGMKYSTESAYKYFVKCLNQKLSSTPLIGYRFYYEEINGSHKLTLYHFGNLKHMETKTPKARVFTHGTMAVYRMIFSMRIDSSLFDKYCNTSVDFKKLPLISRHRGKRSTLETYLSAKGFNFSISDSINKGNIVDIDLEKIEETAIYIKRGCKDNFIKRMADESVSINNRIPFTVSDKNVFVSLEDRWVKNHEFYGITKMTKEMEEKGLKKERGEEDDFIIEDLEQHLEKNISQEMRDSIEKALEEYRNKKRKERLEKEISKNDQLASVSLETVRKNYLDK